MAAPRRCLVLVLLLLTGGLAGCTDPGPPPDDGPANETPEPPSPDETRDSIAWNRVPDRGEVPEPNPERLGELVERQVYENTTTREPRYRTPGTAGHEAAIPVLETMLEEAGARVERESFTVELPKLGEVEATNLYGVREGSREAEIWLAAHWDSRAWADHDPDPDRRERPVLGANDGAAGVAVVVHALELLEPTNLTVKVALFDVEDQGRGGEGWIQGSTHAVDQLTAEDRERLRTLLLVDMPGHEPLSIPREGRSDDRSPTLTDLTFGVAERLEAPSFRNESGPPVLDDHVPFLEANVSAVDLIHLDDNGTSPFPWTWHTTHDTPEHVSNASMAEVTRVVTATAMAVDRGALPPPQP